MTSGNHALVRLGLAATQGDDGSVEVVDNPFRRTGGEALGDEGLERGWRVLRADMLAEFFREGVVEGIIANRPAVEHRVAGYGGVLEVHFQGEIGVDLFLQRRRLFLQPGQVRGSRLGAGGKFFSKSDRALLQISSSSRRGSSRLSFTRTRNDTASRPSMIRWS